MLDLSSSSSDDEDGNVNGKSAPTKMSRPIKFGKVTSHPITVHSIGCQSIELACWPFVLVAFTSIRHPYDVGQISRLAEHRSNLNPKEHNVPK